MSLNRCTYQICLTMTPKSMGMSLQSPKSATTPMIQTLVNPARVSWPIGKLSFPKQNSEISKSGCRSCKVSSLVNK